MNGSCGDVGISHRCFDLWNSESLFLDRHGQLYPSYFQTGGRFGISGVSYGDNSLGDVPPASVPPFTPPKQRNIQCFTFWVFCRLLDLGFLSSDSRYGRARLPSSARASHECFPLVPRHREAIDTFWFSKWKQRP